MKNVTTKFLSHNAGIFLLQMLVFWPVWQWYISTLRDPAEDASVVVALVTAVVFLLWKKYPKEHSQVPLRIPILGTLLYAVTFHLLPPLGRATIAIFVLSYTLNHWQFGDRLQLWLYGLLFLALPVLSPMLFYLGYPIRIIVGRLAGFLLQVSGFSVVTDGLAFFWNGEYIWIDELCSGVRKLWAGLYFAFALAAFYGYGTRKTTIVTGFASLVFILANVLRTAVLFYLKVGIFEIPGWLHEWTGVLMFLFAAVITVSFARRIEDTPQASRLHNLKNTASVPLAVHTSIRMFLLLGITAAFIPLLPISLRHGDSFANFPGWPKQFDGLTLRQLDLSGHGERFARDFPGQIASFTDGEREFIIRWLTRPSRSVRSAWDCFQGTGHTLNVGLLIWRDPQGRRWRTFDAKGSDETLRVFERIYDDAGQIWTDVSSWYWAALLRKTEGPWWIVTIVEDSTLPQRYRDTERGKAEYKNYLASETHEMREKVR